MKNKNTLLLILFCILYSISIFAAETEIKVKNNSEIFRHEVIAVDLDSVQINLKNEKFVVKDGSEIIPAEINGNQLLIYIQLNAGEEKNLLIQTNDAAKKQVKYTKAYLGQKTEYVKQDGYYTGGRFAEVDSAVVPKDHFAHDAVYQFEGPGWESELVGYRLYLDDRNRTDIFGKKKNDLVLDQIGKNDLVSDGKESYQSLMDWGMDIFKVGNSLGIGAAASYLNDSVYTISEYEEVTVKILSGNLQSGVITNHLNWKLADNTYNPEIFYSIKAGSRLTAVTVKLDKAIENICTGLAKHKGTEFLKSQNQSGWNYIAVWGKQTLVIDNLGIALFYKQEDLISLDEDNLSHLVILKPENNSSSYYFAAAWEQEPGGLKNKNEFIKYLNEELIKLNHPIEISSR